MSTLRQIEAARANGARSRGPITPEGKLASSRNAITHGLLAATVALDGESKEGFERVLASFVGQIQPRNPAEASLVETMATARWRLMRIWALQKVAMDLEMTRVAENETAVKPSACPSEAGVSKQAEGILAAIRATLAIRTLTDTSRCLELLHRYETAYDRQFLRAYNSILRIRREEPAQSATTLRPSYVAENPVSATFFDPPRK